MICGLVLWLTLGSAAPLEEAARALAAGRLEQAGEMIAAARRDGVRGEALQRLDADYALARGAHATALAGYRSLIAAHPSDALLLERAGRAALHLGLIEQATAYLDRATLIPAAGWRAWNLRGVAADRRRDFDEAEAAYARAAMLAPGEAAVRNNRGWSLMLRGQWSEAKAEFEAAIQLDPKVAHGVANLELADAALKGDLPSRQPEEGDQAYAARLNDAGVVAAAGGDRARAVAAFTRAIDIRSDWFARASDNLQSLAAGAR